jgi:hypothetical protein
VSELGANAIVCESCGYSLDGLPIDGVCPECAAPVFDSLAEARPGSQWQQHGRLGRGMMEAAARPRVMMRRLRVDRWRDRVLVARVAVVTGAIPAALMAVSWRGPWGAMRMVRGLLPGVVSTVADWLVTWVLMWGAAWVAIVILIGLGMVTIWADATLWRRRRLTWEKARAIGAHASLGLLGGSMLVMLGAGCCVLLSALGVLDQYKSLMYASMASVVGLGVGAGWFAILAHIGLEVCRYPNMTGATTGGAGDA